MYKPTEIEVLIEINKTLIKIEERLTWLLGIVVGIGIAVGVYLRG